MASGNKQDQIMELLRELGRVLLDDEDAATPQAEPVGPPVTHTVELQVDIDAGSQARYVTEDAVARNARNALASGMPHGVSLRDVRVVAVDAQS